MKKITLLILIATSVWAARPYYDMPQPLNKSMFSGDVEHVI